MGRNYFIRLFLACNNPLNSFVLQLQVANRHVVFNRIPKADVQKDWYGFYHLIPSASIQKFMSEIKAKLN